MWFYDTTSELGLKLHAQPGLNNFKLSLHQPRSDVGRALSKEIEKLHWEPFNFYLAYVKILLWQSIDNKICM